MEVKVLHDVLLAHKPDGATHDSTTCPLCVEQVQANAPREGGEMSTFTQEDLERAIAEATAPLQSEIENLRSTIAAAENAKAVDEMKEQMEAARVEAEAQIKELQSKLDAAVLDAQTEKETREGIVAYLESVKAEEERQAELVALRAERIEAIKEVASFPDEYLEANGDRFAAMSVEDFEAAIADWKAIGASKKEEDSTEETIPASTVFKASRTETAPVAVPGVNEMREVMRLNLRGIDPRTL